MKHNGRGVRFEKLSAIKYRLISVAESRYDGEVTIEREEHSCFPISDDTTVLWYAHQQLDNGSAECVSRGFFSLADAKKEALKWELEGRLK